MRYEVQIAYGDWSEKFDCDDADEFIEQSIFEIEMNDGETPFTVHFEVHDRQTDEISKEEYEVALK